jgi:hypothetical protein
MKSIKFLAVAICTLLAGAAFAQDDAAVSSSGGSGNFEAALRVSYGLGLGDIQQGQALSDAFSGFIPAQLDLGWRFNKQWFAGVYAQYGLVFVKNCPDGVSCSANDMRFGIEGQYHVMPDMSLDPWVGLGVGYEIAGTSVSVGDQSQSGSTSGFEFANLSLGGNYKVASNFAVGPVLSFSLGQYSSASQGDVSGDIQNKSMHMLLTFGVRGVFDMM